MKRVALVETQEKKPDSTNKQVARGAFSFKRMRTIVFSFISSVFILASLINLVAPAVSHAIPLTKEDSIVDQVRSYVVFYAFQECLKKDRWQIDYNWGVRISPENAAAGTWWDENSSQAPNNLGETDKTKLYGIAAASFLNQNPGSVTALGNAYRLGFSGCNGVLKSMADIAGYGTNYLDFLCSFVTYRANSSNCQGAGASGDFGDIGIDANLERFREVIGKKIWGGDGTPKITLDTDYLAGYYLLYREAFLQGCGTTSGSTYTAPTSNYPPQTQSQFIYEDVHIIDDSGAATTKNYVGTDSGERRAIYQTPSNGIEYLNCREIVEKLKEGGSYAEAFSDYKFTHPNDQKSPGTIVDRCTDTVLTNDQDCEDVSAATCAIDSIGWWLCPIVEAVANATDGMFEWIVEGLVRTDISVVRADQSNGTFVAWGIMRNIANVAFVIAFIIIIFSQLTGVEIQNYGIKKLLPRLIISAILVNLSFFVCQLAVDISNILGASLKTLFEGIAGNITSATNTINKSLGINSTQDFQLWTGIVPLVIGAAGAALIWVNLGALVGLLFASAISVVVVFLMLIVRQILIILLIVVAPLAFVAFLLPNTERLFTQWRKLFTSLLLLYPITGLIFGASVLASSILNTVFASTSAQSGNIIGQIIAAGALMIPLFAIPFVLKKSLDGIGGLGEMFNKARSGLQKTGDAAYKRSRLGQGLEGMKERQELKRAMTRGGEYRNKKGNLTARSRFNRGLNAITGSAGRSVAARGAALADEADKKAVNEAKTLARRQIAGGANAEAELAKAIKSGDHVRARAWQDLNYEAGGSGVEAVGRQLLAAGTDARSQAAVRAMQTNIRDNHGQMLKGKDASQAAFGSKGGDIQAHRDSATTWDKSAGDLASQTGDRLQAAAAAGLINPQVAQEMINDPNTWNSMEPKQQAAIQQAAAGSQAEYEQKLRTAKQAEAVAGPPLPPPKNKREAKKRTAQDEAYQSYVDAGNVQGSNQWDKREQDEAAASYGSPPPGPGPSGGGSGTPPPSGGSPGGTGGSSGGPGAPGGSGASTGSGPTPSGTPPPSGGSPGGTGGSAATGSGNPRTSRRASAPSGPPSGGTVSNVGSEPTPAGLVVDRKALLDAVQAARPAPEPVEIRYVEPYVPNEADIAEQQAREWATSTPTVDRSGSGSNDPEVFAKQAYDDAIAKMPPWKRPDAAHLERKAAYHQSVNGAGSATPQSSDSLDIDHNEPPTPPTGPFGSGS